MYEKNELPISFEKFNIKNENIQIDFEVTLEDLERNNIEVL